MPASLRSDSGSALLRGPAWAQYTGRTGRVDPDDADKKTTRGPPYRGQQWPVPGAEGRTFISSMTMIMKEGWPWQSRQVPRTLPSCPEASGTTGLADRLRIA
jgi:hypothetical protein